LISQKIPSAFELRVFAVLLCPFCALIAAWIGRRVGADQLGLWAALAILPVSLLGLIWPRSVGGIYRAWMRVTTPVGRVISIVLLSLIYFVVVTPMGLCLRAFGVDPAQRRWNPKLETYWTDRAQRGDESYFHPF